MKVVPDCHVLNCKYYIARLRFRKDDYEFMIFMCYGGNFVDRLRCIKYVGEGIRCYKNCYSDEVSLMEIVNIVVREFGFEKRDILVHRILALPFETGIRPLENDNDVVNMVYASKTWTEDGWTKLLSLTILGTKIVIL